MTFKVIVNKTKDNKWKGVSINPDSFLMSRTHSDLCLMLFLLGLVEPHAYHEKYDIVNFNELPEETKKEVKEILTYEDQ